MKSAAAGAMAMAMVLAGCGSPAPATTLTDVSTEQVLSLLPTEDTLRQTVDTTGTYYRVLDGKAGYSLDPAGKDPCLVMDSPWLYLAGNILEAARVGLYNPQDDANGNSAPAINATVSAFSSPEQVQGFISGVRDATEACRNGSGAQLGIASGTTPHGTRSFRMSTTAADSTASRILVLVPLGRRMLSISGFDIPGQGYGPDWEEATGAYLAALSEEPDAQPPAIIPVATADPDDSSGDAASAEPDRLRIGLKPANIGADGQVLGFDADIALGIAADLGFAPEAIDWKETPPANRESMLETHAVDLIVATYAINETRRERVDFAGPYFTSATDLLIRADDTAISDPASLSGKFLCSVTGSTTAQRVKDQFLPDVLMLEVDSLDACMQRLVAGSVDAVPGDNNILAETAVRNGIGDQVRLLGQRLSEDELGIGIPKSSTRCEQINDALRAMVSDGRWDAAASKNFGGLIHASSPSLSAPEPLPCP